MNALDLFDLKDLTHVPSVRSCENMAEAALVCLTNQNHNETVEIKINGAIQDRIFFKIDEITPRIESSWKDLEEATEYGATCIAMWIILKFTKYQIVQRSPKKTGFDYYLDFQNSEFPFQNRARLERFLGF